MDFYFYNINILEAVTLQFQEKVALDNRESIFRFIKTSIVQNFWNGKLVRPVGKRGKKSLGKG